MRSFPQPLARHCFLFLLLAASVLLSRPLAPLHAQDGDADSCILSLAAPTERYIFPTTAAGSYGPTDAALSEIVALGTDESGTWFVASFEPAGGTPFYAWLARASVTVAATGCDNLPIINPNDVPGSLAAAQAPPASPAPACSISAELANIRAQPSTESEIVGSLENSVVTAIGRTEDSTWYEVDLGNGRGWIAASASNLTGDCEQLPITGSASIDYEDCPDDFIGYRSPRLALGGSGRVIPGNQSNRVRALPQTSSEILFQIQAGTEFLVIGGPQCGAGIVWWQVQVGARTGWTAESDVETAGYFVEPLEDSTLVDALACDFTDGQYRATRLEGANTATINPDIPSLILFTEPDLNSTQILEVASGESLAAIHIGPRCNQNAVWWNVTYNSLRGWVVESSTNDTNTLYYLIPPEGDTPAPGSTTPANDNTAPPPEDTAEGTPPPVSQNPSLDLSREPITSQNVLRLNLSESLALPLGDVAAMAWRRDGQLIAFISADGVRLYSYPALDAQDSLHERLDLITDEDPATAIVFDSTGNILLVGHLSGQISALELASGAVVPFMNHHASAISALAFSADGSRLLSASGFLYETPPTEADFSLQVHDYRTFSMADGIAEVRFRHDFAPTAPILAATFSPAGTAITATYDGVQVVNAEGVAFSTGRAESPFGIHLEAAARPWGNGSSSILFGTGNAVAVYDTATGEVVPRPVVLLESGARIIDFAAAPTFEAALIAVAVDVESSAGDGVRFATPIDSSGRYSGSIAVTGVVDLNFSPDGTVLALRRADGIEFWTVTTD